MNTDKTTQNLALFLFLASRNILLSITTVETDQFAQRSGVEQIHYSSNNVQFQSEHGRQSIW